MAENQAFGNGKGKGIGDGNRMTGTLYITATPIGNLEDMTCRAVRILREVDFIACEDTRNSIKLLNYFDIHTPMTAYHKFSTEKETQAILDRLLAGESCALITDAGTPCISDPGSRLTALAINNGIKIESVPGACAFVTALTLSGFDAQSFMFAGFPPRRDKELTGFLTEIADRPYPVGLYEAPGRVKKTLTAINGVMPLRTLSFSRELTKLHEETVRGTAGEILAAYENREIKGEAVIIIDAAPPKSARELSDSEIAEMLNDIMEQGTKGKDAVRCCADRTGVSKNRIYKIYIDGTAKK